MGHYYRAVFLNQNNKPKAVVVSYDFGSGAKLMEHSWAKNPMVRFVERQLMLEPQKVVWAGDYADNEDPSTLTNEEIKALADEECKYSNSEVIKKDGVNLYTLSDLPSKLIHNEDVKDKYSHTFNSSTLAPLTAKYLINHDKKEFVNKTKVPTDKDGWRIHPLPLLTVEGNLRGGGDYRSDNGKEFVGIWARDMISVESKKSNIPKDYIEIVPNFCE